MLLALVFVVRACNNSRHKEALRNYNLQVSGIATESRQTGEQFFEAMNQGGSQAPADLYGQVIQLKNSADKSLAQARELDVPDDMASAQQALLISLELRRDGLTKVAEDVKTALGDEGEAADRAIGSIAGQMQAFNASDVLYDSRVIPFVRKELQDAEGGHGHPGPEVAVHARHQLGLASSTSPPSSGSSSRAAVTATARAAATSRPARACTAPAWTRRPTARRPCSPASNRLTYVAGQAFSVAFTNQGDNDEFNIKVTVKIERESGGSPITLTKTVQRVAKGEKATVTLPLNREPPLDTVVNITTTVASVPGEKTKDNNTATYPSVFVQG